MIKKLREYVLINCNVLCIFQFFTIHVIQLSHKWEQTNKNTKNILTYKWSLGFNYYSAAKNGSVKNGIS